MKCYKSKYFHVIFHLIDTIKIKVFWFNHVIEIITLRIFNANFFKCNIFHFLSYLFVWYNDSKYCELSIIIWSLIKLYPKCSNLLLFWPCQFIEAIFVIFVAIVFVLFDDKLSMTIIVSSHVVSEILFKYLLFSKIHVLGFRL